MHRPRYLESSDSRRLRHAAYSVLVKIFVRSRGLASSCHVSICITVGDAPAMTARIHRYSAPGARTAVSLFETVVRPLVNAPSPARFEF